ncbi:MAG: transcription antitermination factor NusB [Corynebacterium sp.]|nr:transcription antitermination factor NusB [Corynebacterium sp.]
MTEENNLQASSQDEASAHVDEGSTDTAKGSSQRVAKERRRGARYRARRRATDILYEAENRDVDPVAIVEDRVTLARDPENGVAPVAEYTKVLVAGVAEELDAIDAVIERFLSADWELFRIPAVDRAIMRVAVWEILYNPEVDAATALTEGVELASEYSTHAAAPYIHSVLDDVAQSAKEDNPMA